MASNPPALPFRPPPSSPPRSFSYSAEQQPPEVSAIASGIMNATAPALLNLDLLFLSVRNSQVELHKELERLLAELQILTEMDKPTKEFEEQLIKMNALIKRYSNACNSISQSEERLESLISKGTAALTKLESTTTTTASRSSSPSP